MLKRFRFEEKQHKVQGVNEEANQEQFSSIKPHPNLDITANMEIGNYGEVPVLAVQTRAQARKA